MGLVQWGRDAFPRRSGDQSRRQLVEVAASCDPTSSVDVSDHGAVGFVERE